MKASPQGTNKNEMLQVLYEQWVQAGGKWESSQLVIQARTSIKGSKTGARRWMMRSEIVKRYGCEETADELILAKESDPTLFRTQVRNHPELPHRTDLRLYLCWDESYETDTEDVLITKMLEVAQNDSRRGRSKDRKDHKKKDKKKRKRSTSSSSSCSKSPSSSASKSSKSSEDCDSSSSKSRKAATKITKKSKKAKKSKDGKSRQGGSPAPSGASRLSKEALKNAEKQRKKDEEQAEKKKQKEDEQAEKKRKKEEEQADKKRQKDEENEKKKFEKEKKQQAEKEKQKQRASGKKVFGYGV